MAIYGYFLTILRLEPVLFMEENNFYEEKKRQIFQKLAYFVKEIGQFFKKILIFQKIP